MPFRDCVVHIEDGCTSIIAGNHDLPLDMHDDWYEKHYHRWHRTEKQVCTPPLLRRDGLVGSWNSVQTVIGVNVPCPEMLAVLAMSLNHVNDSISDLDHPNIVNGTS